MATKKSVATQRRSRKEALKPGAGLRLVEDSVKLVMAAGGAVAAACATDDEQSTPVVVAARPEEFEDELSPEELEELNFIPEIKFLLGKNRVAYRDSVPEPTNPGIEVCHHPSYWRLSTCGSNDCCYEDYCCICGEEL